MTEGPTFEGQQTGERVLYTVLPHALAKIFAIARLVLLVVFFFLIVLLISTIVPQYGGIFRLVGILFGILVLGGGVWWNTIVYAKAKTYLTDRRIVRVDVVSPFFQTKRALFWSEALKAKAYAPNILYRFLNIGTIQVMAQMAEHEDVTVKDVYYFEDLANYIDKILFTFKNTQSEILNIKPFVPKAKGQRDLQRIAN